MPGRSRVAAYFSLEYDSQKVAQLVVCLRKGDSSAVSLTDAAITKLRDRSELDDKLFESIVSCLRTAIRRAKTEDPSFSAVYDSSW